MPQVLALLRGGALAVAVGVVVFAFDIVTGFAFGDAEGVFLTGAVAAVIFGLVGRQDKVLTMVGAGLAGAAAILLGMLSGFGALDWALVLGAVLSILWVWRGESTGVDPSGLVWFGLAVALLVVVVLPLILDGGALGHDESAYALKARQWLEGTPGTGWGMHRGIGMSVFGYVVLALGGSEGALRMIGLVGAVGLAAGVWALGREMSRPLTGSVAAIAIIAGPHLLFRSTEYLSDVPSAALLVWCMVVIWRELGRREAPTYRLLWLVPLVVVAFYLRYQSALSLLLVGLVSLCLWWSKLRRRPGPVLAVIGLVLAALVPHFLFAMELFGSPFGIVLSTGENAVRTYVGQGLADYRAQFGWELAGWVGPIALAAAFMDIALGFRESETRVRQAFLLVPALAQVLMLGLISHGEPRFLFFPVALVVVAGAIGVDQRLVRGRQWARAVAFGLAVVVAGSLGLSAVYARDRVGGRSANNEPLQLAAALIAEDSPSRDCAVMTSNDAQVTFYSACATSRFRADADPRDAVAALPGESRYLLLVDGSTSQPTGDDLEALISLTEGEPTLVDGRRRDAVFYRFAD